MIVEKQKNSMKWHGRPINRRWARSIGPYGYPGFSLKAIIDTSAGFLIKKKIVVYFDSSVLGWKLKATELMQ